MLQYFVCSSIPKVSEKRGNRSEFHSERNYYLKNWYFRGKNKKNETKVAESQKVFQLYRFLKKCVKSLSSKFFTLVEKLRIEITNLPRFLRNDKLKKTPWDQSNFNLLPKVSIAPQNMWKLQFDNIFIWIAASSTFGAQMSLSEAADAILGTSENDTKNSSNQHNSSMTG